MRERLEQLFAIPTMRDLKGLDKCLAPALRIKGSEATQCFSAAIHVQRSRVRMSRIDAATIGGRPNA